MYKRIAQLIILIIGVCFGMFVLAPDAKADLPDPIPAECQHYVDQAEDYLNAVIRNYQEALTYQEEQTAYWKAAEERVAENAVKRNYEYAAEVEKNRKLTDKLRHKNFVIAQLREQLRSK